MNSTMLYAALGLLIATGYPTAIISHGLVHLFLFVRLPGAADFVARNTATVNALLPAALDQAFRGPSATLLAQDLDDASKKAPENVTLAAWALRAKKVAGLPLAVLLLVGCSAGPKILHSIQLSSTAIVVAEPCLVKAYELEQQSCLDDSPTDLAKARACVSDVRARWKDVAQGFTDLRNVRCEIEPAKCAGGAK